MKFKALLCLFLGLPLGGLLQADPPLFELPAGEPFTADPYANETPEARDARMGWWREARFGMFIHWGLYAVPAGFYKGEPVGQIGEWIMLRGEIPVEEYKAYAEEFNPTSYDPAYWAQLAKRAGMRYMVITSKHHDGFALFPSAVTDWDIEDATPYGKDLIGPLADAARAEGLKFGLYYSQAQDWIHPGGSLSGNRLKSYEKGTPLYWDKAQVGDFNDYLRDIAIPQTGEILSRYRPDILWWDTPRGIREEHAAKLAPLLRIVPGIIHNNRLGGGFEGDTETPEQHIPATGFKDRDWEVCMTMNNTWGYKRNDENWKSTEVLIQKLCDIVSKGGNFLLNIGPRADGTIPEASIERLEAIGRWMEINGDSIYGTSASPFHRLTWGRATQKAGASGTRLFLHVFEWPKNGELIVPGLRNQPVSARLLDGQQPLSFEQRDGSLTIRIPDTAPDPYASVIELEIQEPLDIFAVMPEQTDDGSIELNPDFVDLHQRGYGDKIALGELDGKAIIHQWTEPRAWLSWTFRVAHPGEFEVSAEIAVAEDAALTIGLADGEPQRTELKGSGDDTRLTTQSLGTITIAEAGTFQLEVRPDRDKWSPATLRRITLRPVQ